MLATCYGALADADSFRTWVQQALDARGAAARVEETRVFRQWLSNPLSFPAWGRRARAEAEVNAEAGAMRRARVSAGGEATALRARTEVRASGVHGAFQAADVFQDQSR